MTLLLQALTPGRLAQLSLSETCSQLSQTLAEPTSAAFFREVGYTLALYLCIPIVSLKI